MFPLHPPRWLPAASLRRAGIVQGFVDLGHGGQVGPASSRGPEGIWDFRFEISDLRFHGRFGISNLRFQIGDSGLVVGDGAARADRLELLDELAGALALAVVGLRLLRHAALAGDVGVLQGCGPGAQLARNRFALGFQI